MVAVMPFRGLRPRPELVPRVACPPYDVVTTKEARRLAEGNPHSFLRVIRSEIEMEPGADPRGEAVYRRARENLTKMIAGGVLVRDETECLYVYRMTAGHHVQHGLVMGASLDEYESGRIRRHEHTRPEKEEDRTRHILALKANTGPVMLTYRARDEITGLVQEICAVSEPVCDFTAGDSVGHALWVVSAPGDIRRMRSAFEPVDALYIADGHHRAAAACRARSSCFLAAAFPHDEMRILGYHRVVKDLGGYRPEGFMQRIGRDFRVEPASEPQPDKPGCFGMLLDGNWYRLEAREPGPRDLDAAVLQEKLLGPVLGIGDPRTDVRIDFVGGDRAISELEKRCQDDMRLGFALHPLLVRQMMEVADRGETLPPKSTWFEPKLRSGVVVLSFE